MVSKFLFLAALTLLAVSAVFVTPQATIAFDNDETIRVTPSDDAYVRSLFPLTNYGSQELLQLNSATNDTMVSYLKFVVAGVTGRVEGATLNLYSQSGSPAGAHLYVVSNSYRTGGLPWSESGLLWPNAPALSASPLTAAGAIPPNSWISLDVSAVVTGNGTYSFALATKSATTVHFRSSEAGQNGPMLLIDVIPPTNHGVEGKVPPPPEP
ncbi:MAG: DNRLRE domain-containing protein, partial [Chloroflexota bacterium]